MMLSAVTGPAQRYEVAGEMSFFQSCKVTNREQVVNSLSWSLLATLTYAVGIRHCFPLCYTPPDAASMREATSPSWVCGAYDKLRLPFSHAVVIAEDLFRMEITTRPNNGFSTPITGIRCFALLGGVRRSFTPLVPASGGAEAPLTPMWSDNRFAADLTDKRRALSPTMFQVAGDRAKLSELPAPDTGAKRCAAFCADRVETLRAI